MSPNPKSDNQNPKLSTYRHKKPEAKPPNEKTDDEKWNESRAAAQLPLVEDAEAEVVVVVEQVVVE